MSGYINDRFLDSGVSQLGTELRIVVQGGLHGGRDEGCRVRQPRRPDIGGEAPGIKLESKPAPRNPEIENTKGTNRVCSDEAQN